MPISEFIKKMMFSRKLSFEQGRFEMLGIRGVILPTFTITKFIEEVYQENGDRVFDMMFEAGKKHGRTAVEKLGREHGVSKREFLSKLMDSANVMGLGEMEIMEMEQNYFKSSIKGSPFVEEFKKSEVLKDVERPVTEFVRGISHGIGEEFFDSEVKTEYEASEFQGDQKTVIKVSEVK